MTYLEHFTANEPPFRLKHAPREDYAATVAHFTRFNSVFNETSRV